MLGQGRRCLMVSENDRVIGLLALQDIKKIPGERWAMTTAREAMVPVSQLKTINSDTELNVVFKIIISENISQIPVEENGEIIGIIARENVFSFINLRSQLGK
jgi:predicted transcriptional regulator